MILRRHFQGLTDHMIGGVRSVDIVPAGVDAVDHRVEAGAARRVVPEQDVRGVVAVVVADPDYAVRGGGAADVMPASAGDAAAASSTKISVLARTSTSVSAKNTSVTSANGCRAALPSTSR
jgi:hypothetical protein